MAGFLPLECVLWIHLEFLDEKGELWYRTSPPPPRKLRPVLGSSGDEEMGYLVAHDASNPLGEGGSDVSQRSNDGFLVCGRDNWFFVE
ncbi:MAG: hypothetical protein ACE5R6_02040 [Candidatus Heimdallarchaeota archaeon]